ncbi:MAG: hypothetical protein JXA82_04340 [Sedimentisphaerales bacterium]|nr:hypothetical protein [Sedimentisphaerales bacterium]
MSNNPLIRSLDSLSEADRPFVGSKATNLARMIHTSLPVPSGFVISTEVFRVHIPVSILEEDPAVIRTRIEGMTLSDDLLQQIELHYHALGETTVAVRSSATDEDLPGHSFAGQYESFLNISTAEECIEAVKKCWASLWSDRAVEYRRQNGIDPGTIAMAVIVQEMIDADVSGLVFTADPVTGDRQNIVVEAAPGLGENIVQGRVEPQRFTLNRNDFTVLNRQLPSPDTLACLDEHQLRQLAQKAIKVEGLFKNPQDIEWSIKDGQIWLLQARPITSLSNTKDADWDTHQIWTNVNAGEVIPDVVTPMTDSILRPNVVKLLQAFLDIGGIDMDPSLLIGCIAGRYYFNVNAVLSLIRHFPGTKDKDLSKLLGGREDEFSQMGVNEINPAYIPPSRKRLGQSLRSLIQFIPCLLPTVYGRAQRGLNVVTSNTERIVKLDYSCMTDREIAQTITEIVSDALNLGQAGPLIAITMFYSTILFELCYRWFDDKNHRIGNQLMSGVGGLNDAQSGFDLYDLAALATQDPFVKEVVTSGEPFETIRSRLESQDAGQIFLAQWERFLHKHGHHARGEIEVTNVRWAEQPDRILEMVRNHLPGPNTIDPKDTLQHLRQQSQETLRQCRKKLNPLKRWIFSAVVSRARLGSQIRENVKNEFARRVATTRWMLLELGKRLTQKGIFNKPEDVFFVHYDELSQILDETLHGQIHDRIRQRRAEYEYNCSLHPPPIVVGRFNPSHYIERKPDKNRKILTGLAVSPGVVTGLARVILHASDDLVRPGEILVVPVTDPAWTPYFINAAGIVMDTGGLLSHGSIVAREFGKPCVVNAGPATKIIQTGQMLRVDGDQGIVTILD